MQALEQPYVDFDPAPLKIVQNFLNECFVFLAPYREGFSVILETQIFCGFFFQLLRQAAHLALRRLGSTVCELLTAPKLLEQEIEVDYFVVQRLDLHQATALKDCKFGGDGLTHLCRLIQP